MANFRDLLESDRAHVFDGAMGTMLYARGVYINRSFDELNLTSPDLVLGVHDKDVGTWRRPALGRLFGIVLGQYALTAARSKLWGGLWPRPAANRQVGWRLGCWAGWGGWCCALSARRERGVRVTWGVARASAPAGLCPSYAPGYELTALRARESENDSAVLPVDSAKSPSGKGVGSSCPSAGKTRC